MKANLALGSVINLIKYSQIGVINIIIISDRRFKTAYGIIRVVCEILKAL